jgi:hypothetical protein
MKLYLCYNESVSIIASAVVLAMLSTFGTLAALATQSPTSLPGLGQGGGQPGASTNPLEKGGTGTTCNSSPQTTQTPGGSANAAGSPFNPNGGLPNGGGAANNA